MKFKVISLVLLVIGLCSCERINRPNNSKEAKEDANVGATVDIDTCTFNPNYLNIEKYDIHLSRADTLNRIYVLEYTGEAPDIKSGNVLTLDADSLGYLVRVNKVQKEQNRITLKAEQACLCDLFANMSFILSTSTEETEITKSSGVQVIHPVAVSYFNQDGVRVIESSDSPTKAISDRENIWKEGIKYDGKILWQKGNTYLKVDECHINGSLDLEFYLSFGGFEEKEDNEKDIKKQYSSKALALNAKLIGTLNLAEVFHFHTEGKFNTREGHDLSDYNELVKHKVLPDLDFKFIVGGVPVWVKIGTDLFREVNLQGEGNLDFVLGYRNTTELNSGFKWSQTGGISPIASASNTFTLVGPTLTGHGKVNGKCWPFYPRINARFYSLLGPNFDIKPYLQCTLEGGFQLDAGGNSYAGWSLGNDAGLDFKAGLSFYFMNYEANRLYETNNITLYNKPLYRSPLDIRRTDDEDCKAGSKNTLTFTVIDKDELQGRNVVTILPQIVTFEGEGKLSKKFAITSGGKVSVDWTPSTKDDIMEAIIYGPNGEMIKKVTVEASPGEGCPDEAHIHAIDLGLSVKWACCNVGATKPEEYGGHYAWGETKEKSMYTEVTYKYAHGTETNDDGWYEDCSYDNIGSDISGTQYDVAHVKWGGSWRMPTIEEFKELYNNCISEWTTLNGVYGQKFTSKINGNSIFLPAANCRYYDLYSVGDGGFYWSSSLCTNNHAYLMNFYCGGVSTNSDYRWHGHSVRPVSK